MSCFRSPEMWKSQGERSGINGGCCIPGCFDFIACSRNFSHQETNHTSLLFFACLHFQYWTNTLCITLTSRAITAVWTCAFSLRMSPTLRMTISIRNISVASCCEECFLWWVFGFLLTACSFSNLSVTSPTSQLILQPFRRFAYVTAHSPTLPLLHLRHSSFSNPSFASFSSHVLHLIHLASRPWLHLDLEIPSFTTTYRSVDRTS